ncbi:hypothetical protein SUGI_0253770 [Cryptomeria japonica]|nr:hypothetical protein SUGI_0253770 [Cryptomeria japonica]
MWVHLIFLLLVGLDICSDARLVPQNNGLYIVPQQNSRADLANEEASETKPWSPSETIVTKEKANNLVEFRFRENRTGGDAEHETVGLKVQALWTSEPSTGVGHMKVSRQRGAMKRMHKERILGSTPSPGGGH